MKLENSGEYILDNFIWPNSFSSFKQIPGRIIISVMHVCKRFVTANDTSLLFFDQFINKSIIRPDIANVIKIL